MWMTTGQGAPEQQSREICSNAPSQILTPTAGAPEHVWWLSDQVLELLAWGYDQSGLPPAADVVLCAGTEAAVHRAVALSAFAIAREDLPTKLEALRLAGESRGLDMSPLITLAAGWRSLWSRHPEPADAMEHFREHLNEQATVEALNATVTRLRDRLQLEVRHPGAADESEAERGERVQQMLNPQLPQPPDPLANLINAVNRAMVQAGNLAMASENIFLHHPNGEPAPHLRHTREDWVRTTDAALRAHPRWLAAMDEAIAAGPAAWECLRANSADLAPGWTTSAARSLIEGRRRLAQKTLGYPWDAACSEWMELYDTLYELLKTLQAVHLDETAGADRLAPNERAIWDALQGTAMTGRELVEYGCGKSPEQAANDIAAIRQKLGPRAVVNNRDGWGYWRADAPPDWSALKVTTRKRRTRPR